MTRKMAPVDEQLAVLMSGVDYGDALLKRQMERELRALLEQDRPLRVYLGIDPTATSLTLGHTVPLRKLRQFQQFGHDCVFLIGDYTALIGDPSDKNKLRPMLTQEDIALNEATYFEQAARILDPAKTELRHNSEWLGKLTFPDIISLMSKFTAAEMLRRENFRRRWEDGDAVYLHEFLYALMQGYDAYALACDAQVGGTEQLFQPDGGPEDPGGRGAEAARAGDHAHPGGARRQGADVEVEGQPHRGGGPTGGAIRQGDVDPGRGPGELFYAGDEPPPGRRESDHGRVEGRRTKPDGHEETAGADDRQRVLGKLQRRLRRNTSSGRCSAKRSPTKSPNTG
ncbi:MAG: tyrosine--tRNA ligase [Dehalococcoidia bacterium]|nr:tyrosine--tRNA ligase [Dehalococcoidia bacterium]